MPSNAAKLVIEMTSDQSDAVAGFEDVTAAAREMAREVEDAGRASEAQARKLGLSADAADELGGKAGKATGALGALGSGFELVGAGKYATALQGAAMATDFMSGVGDSLNLVMESTILQNVRAKAATIASAVASKAAAVATGVQTAAQWALNAAMSANPIALVVIAVVALIAGLVLLYKRSDKARAIMQKIGHIGAAAFGAVVGAVKSVVGWVGDKLPGAFDKGKTVIVTAVRIYTLPIRTLLTVLGWVVSKVAKLPGAMSSAKDKLLPFINAVLTPFRKLKDLIDDVLGAIGKIKLPHIPGVNIPGVPGIRASAASGVLGSSAPTEPTYQITVQVQPFTDPDAVARSIEKVLGRRARRFGVA
jgi:hypothetical protein